MQTRQVFCCHYAKPHAVTSAGSYLYQYDANGNPSTALRASMTMRAELSGTQRLTFTKQFNIENRLVAVTNTVSGQVTQFTYDGDGKRVLQQFSDGSKTAYASAIEISITSTQRITKSYYQLSGKLVAMRVITSATNSTLYYMHSDHLGSASLTTSASGSMVATQRYGAWGNIRAMTGAMPTDIGYTGQRLDSTGLMFYQARYYDANIGRFISADTVVPGAGSPQTLNRYSYVHNNPLKYTDPSGHEPGPNWWVERYNNAHGLFWEDDTRQWVPGEPSFRDKEIFVQVAMEKLVGYDYFNRQSFLDMAEESRVTPGRKYYAMLLAAFAAVGEVEGQCGNDSPSCREALSTPMLAAKNRLNCNLAGKCNWADGAKDLATILTSAAAFNNDSNFDQFQGLQNWLDSQRLRMSNPSAVMKLQIALGVALDVFTKPFYPDITRGADAFKADKPSFCTDSKCLQLYGHWFYKGDKGDLNRP